MNSILTKGQNLLGVISFSILLCSDLIKAGTTAIPGTTTEDPGLYTVDYIIIGVASAAIAAALCLLVVVVISNRKKSKQAMKIDPGHEQGAIMKNESEADGINSVLYDNPAS